MNDMGYDAEVSKEPKVNSTSTSKKHNLHTVLFCSEDVPISSPPYKIPLVSHVLHHLILDIWKFKDFSSTGYEKYICD